MTVKKADSILCRLEELAQIYEYDIDNDNNYKAACELVTVADWNEKDIEGFELDEFSKLVNAVHMVIIEEV